MLKPFPILSFPCVQLIGCSVRELVSSSELQAKGMKAVADRCPSLASVSMMDLSVEAEAFGAEVIFSDNEVPAVKGALISDEESADNLCIPAVGSGRTGIFVDAIEKACSLIKDRPVFAGVTGPFSLAGRLMDVTETMIYCYDEPDMVKTVVSKATDFLIGYIRAFKKAGAAGVVVAEPLAGLLSPDMAEEFSNPYIKRIADAVQDGSFAVVYHNCGPSVTGMAESLAKTGCRAFHFGNAVNMKEMLEKMPDNVAVMGNIDPSARFYGGIAVEMEMAVRALTEQCSSHKNFILSSGCDIPPMAKWENIDAFFRSAQECGWSDDTGREYGGF